VASGKFDPETEERVSQAIETELLAITAPLPANTRMEIAAEHSQHVGVTPNIG